ncbi:uncharacterized protein SPSK_06570 [Sporothrix schenckii 1099-18]|uniref:Yeast cell wall synthesis Kre9/Knh1-like N-terminal domain-containing protein n=1 Tax=Sporothrix schenckii 1099-18 TaxID=1397361 RepID=A0A0F2MJS2_SPOSC|nr:uncharacterized protein SPSK_06570 [Sporothrix schenckii 1099-18]KJR89324.1 hypothetical protein SPSK_06570 [Sporothrix schenckii 1099-18]
MPSFASFAAALALGAAVVRAQDANFDSVTTPLRGAQVPAGQPFTVTWTLISATTPTGPTTITLVGGEDAGDLKPIAAIGHVQNQDLKFVWNVDAGLGAAKVYGLNFTLDADNSHFQYSNPFTIVGGAASGGGGGGTTGTATGTATGTGTGTGTGTATETAPTTGTGAATDTTGTTSTASATTSPTGAGTTTTVPTTTAAPTHASNSTRNSTTATASASKTSAKPPTETSGATGLSGLSAVGVLAMALVASAAMHWGL